MKITIARFAAVVAIIAVALLLGVALAGVPATAEDWASSNLTATPGAGRASATGVEAFTLEPALHTSPTSATIGDTISLHAQDFANLDAGFTSSKIAGQEDVKVAASGATLLLSQNLARSNERINIIGYGFSTGHGVVIDPADIRLDGVPVPVDETSLRGGKVAVSYNGWFVAAIRLWRDDAAAAQAGIADSDNPALIAGRHTITVRDSSGFHGSAIIVIKEPSLSILPVSVGPRDYLRITGVDWPKGSVSVVVGNRTYTVVTDQTGSCTGLIYFCRADGTGSFSVEHRVGRDVPIPSIQRVRASYGAGQIVKTAIFVVPPATVAVSPSEGQPGDEVTLNIGGMPGYTEGEEITIGGIDVLGPQHLRTDRNGDATATVVIPGIDPGTYSVVVKVGGYGGSNQTVATGSLQVRAGYGAGQAVNTAPFVEVSPGEGQPGDEVTLNIGGMPVYIVVHEITVGGAKVLGGRVFHTDRDGAVTATVAIPGLDPGTYSVVVKVGSGSIEAVATGSITVLR